nr:DNA packaging protein UL32 [Psittacid alphaherpesvirus 6]
MSVDTQPRRVRADRSNADTTYASPSSLRFPMRSAEAASPFTEITGTAEGWAEGAFEGEYCAFDPSLLSLNDSLFNELLLAAHVIRINPIDLHANDDNELADAFVAVDGNAIACSLDNQGEISSFIDVAADAFGLDRQCLVCRVLDAYRREYGFSAQWVADYAFLCAKCLAAPPCATVTFIAAFEFIYIMDKHFLRERGATLVSAFGRKILTHEDVQRHFFLHGCFRTDGGVPGRKPDDVVIARPRPGRPLGGRAGPLALGSAKVLYSNYSFLVQSVTRALMSTLADYGTTNKSFGTITSIGSGLGKGSIGPPTTPAIISAYVGGKGCRNTNDASHSEQRRQGDIGGRKRKRDREQSLDAMEDEEYEMRSCRTSTRSSVIHFGRKILEDRDVTSTSSPCGGQRCQTSDIDGITVPQAILDKPTYNQPGGSCDGTAGPYRTCPTQLAVALAGWKECAKGVECVPSVGRRGDSCVARAVRDDEEYEMSLEREEEAGRAGTTMGCPMGTTTSYASLFSDPCTSPRASCIDAPCQSSSLDTERSAVYAHAAARETEGTRGYGDLTLLLLAGTGAVPLAGNVSRPGWVDEFVTMASNIRKDTVETFWETNRASFGASAVNRFLKFYEEGAEPDLDLGPIMLTQLKHAQTRNGTSAECLPCNLLIVKEYWRALRRLRRDVIAYSSNNVGLFHSVEPVLDEWDEENKVGVDDGGCFINLLRGAGAEAIYKHLFCDPMCAARVVQTDPKVLFEHPTCMNTEELVLHKARLASINRFEGRVCAGLWALAYAFKIYQIFPPRPTALAAFVKDAGSMLYRHSVSLISLEHTLGAYV